ncbi:MAG: NPCBM/NEW2 domain-containing protein [Massilia sp.]
MTQPEQEFRTRQARRIALGALLSLTAVVTCAADAPTPAPHASGLPANASAQALLPPMGWNPWNAFYTEVTEEKILAVAEKLKQSGLAGAGYRYVNIDDGWWLRRRADGRMQIRTSMFPSAARGDDEPTFRPLVERLHAMGLKAGLYTDIGRNACSQRWNPTSPNLPVGTQAEREVGSMDYQAQDMRLVFGEWGFDYLKVDACGIADYGPDQPPVKQGQFRAVPPLMVRSRPDLSDAAKVERLYADIKDAIKAVRPDGDYLLSICAWGDANVNDWGHKYGNLWRTSADIGDNWKSMLHNFDSAASRPLYAGPGHWNDPDMLEIGLGEFDANHLVEARAHMSMWAIINAPLLLGYDLTKSPQSLIDIAGKREVIAINQDPAGNQGVTLMRDGDRQVIVKTLAQAGHKAVALINRGKGKVTITVPLSGLNLSSVAGTTARDLWSGREVTLASGAITMALAPRETALLLVKGSPALGTGLYVSEMPGRIEIAADGRAGLASALQPSWVAAQVNAAPSGAPLALEGARFANGLGVLANSRLALRLDREFARFRATVGELDETRDKATARTLVYRVYGDGKLLAQTSSAGMARIDVAVKDVSSLTLSVENSAPAASPVAVAWADARLER